MIGFVKYEEQKTNSHSYSAWRGSLKQIKRDEKVAMPVFRSIWRAIDIEKIETRVRLRLFKQYRPPDGSR